MPIPNRTSRPRVKGVTMVIDKGIGISQARDIVQTAGDYIDIVKLSFGTSRLMAESLVRRKIALYKKNRIDVMPGGTLLEVAVVQRSTDKFLRYAKRLGFSALEVSDGTISFGEDVRYDLVTRAAGLGLKVFAEVGKKHKEEDLSAEGYAERIRRDLEKGVFLAIVEAREAGREVGVYDEKGDVRESRLDEIVKGVDVDRLMFEAPEKKQQTYFILRYGANVNLGNVAPTDVIACEALRCGLRADTLREAYPNP